MINDQQIGLTGKWNFFFISPEKPDHENWEPATPQTVSYPSRLMDVLDGGAVFIPFHGERVEATIHSSSLSVTIIRHSSPGYSTRLYMNIHTYIYSQLVSRKSCKMILTSHHIGPPLRRSPGCYPHIAQLIWLPSLIPNCNQVNNRLCAP